MTTLTFQVLPSADIVTLLRNWVIVLDNSNKEWQSITLVRNTHTFQLTIEYNKRGDYINEDRRVTN